MNDIHLESKIVAAATRRSDDTNTFVKQTMDKIKRTSLGAQIPQKQRSFLYQIFRLHKSAAIVLAIVALALLSGVAYAAVHFAPNFVKLLDKETNSRGATEYSVSGFADCVTNSQSAPERFELKSEVSPNSDEEIRKILQAKCELQWLEEFPKSIWPTTGPGGEWKDGDTIHYTRLDMLGIYRGGDQNNATLDFGTHTTKFTSPKGTDIRAFAAGKEIRLGDIKPGDTVFTISRVAEIHRKPGGTVLLKDGPTQYESGQPGQPKVEGVVGLFKMSLPYDYYMQKQNYLTPVEPCANNEGELCPNTPTIDVYPRGSGEGASNPYLNKLTDAEYHQISGTVTELGDDRLVLKSRSGKTYTTTVGDAGFLVYNRDYTSAYSTSGIDAKLKVGSRVNIVYLQPKNADPTQIAKEQVQMVSLQLEGLNPKQGLKPY